MRPSRNEQTLFELAISIALAAREMDPGKVTVEEVAEWAKEQFAGCGFPSRGPVGITWGVLTSVPGESEHGPRCPPGARDRLRGTLDAR